MIVLVLVRRCVCETCNGFFDLGSEQEYPVFCPICDSRTWNGADSYSQAKLRHGYGGKRRVLNPGATSKKRQEHGRRQWRQFKPKPVDEPDKPR